MSADLLAALCLVLLIEGLLLFVAPEAWKRAIAELSAQPAARLRGIGGGMVVVGLVALYLVRGG
ncbi:DUF2065 family protein [Arenimonas oryziterrae]|uniref:DUF2065 domain-containing protein n=1 Tax=Arenimonas oryziterrae DSM 21050 = YC6267 TaxID=1121015 RepID=A0A091AMC4_9GAMM|nr:DUF2065 family protein [Arenimonas oryziterrae]KFN41353.1 hypothetical protein N789_05625 [Arenimonas oryziterrae DSM 21050 = YC6267]